MIIGVMCQSDDSNKYNRRSIRLRGWDYRWPGIYFITICTHQRQQLFVEQQFHDIAAFAWQAIPNHDHARAVELDEWIIMPNHLHGLLILTAAVKQNKIGPAPGRDPNGPAPGSVGAIIGNFKSLVARRINNLRQTPGVKVWQRGYYDRIIRNERQLETTRRYIQDNPRRGAENQDNLDRLLSNMRFVG
jgi:putative transposase